MGNENEIIKEETRGHSLFLPEEIHDQDGKGRIYVLEEEYAKSKKNKNYKLYFFMLIFVLAVIGGVYLFKMVSEHLDKNVVVDIQEFEDLRLKEVIDSARKHGSNIDGLRIDLQTLEVEMLDEMLNVHRDSFRKEMDALGKSLSDEETNRIVAQIKSDEAAQLKRVSAAYQGLIRRKRSEIYALEDAQEKEHRELEKKGAEAKVSNTDRLYSLQMKKLREKQDTGIEAMKKYFDGYRAFLMLKYNPVFAGRDLARIMNFKAEASLTGGGMLKEYDPLLDEFGYSAEDFSVQRKRISDYVLLMKRVKRVPYKNSMPAALASLDSLSGEIVRNYENLWSKLVQSLHARNQYMKRYQYLLDYALNAKKENGLVVDSRDPNNILVHMDQSLNISSGQVAGVFNGDKYVGKVRLLKDGMGNYRAQVVVLASKNAKIQPTNRIVLDLKKIK